jgi:hypothetical protein
LLVCHCIILVIGAFYGLSFRSKAKKSTPAKRSRFADSPFAQNGTPTKDKRAARERPSQRGKDNFGTG